MTKSELTIGVLALQGAFIEHVKILQELLPKYRNGGEVIQVKTPEQLGRCDALVIPGGESTTMSLVAERNGLLEPLREFVNTLQKPVWGTCAGLILLANEAAQTTAGGQELIGGLDVSVVRNHFGRQLDSFVKPIKLSCLDEEYPCVFIRAPIVGSVGKDVTILAKLDDDLVVAVEQGHILGTAFHPELTQDTRIHEYWLQKFVL